MTQRFRLFPIVIVTALMVIGFKIADFIRDDTVSIASIGKAIAQEKPADKKAGKETKPEDMKKDGKKADKDAKKGMKAPKEQVVTNLSQSQVALLEA